MRQGFFIVGAGLAGIYVYDFVAGKINNSMNKDALPTLWGFLFSGTANGPNFPSLQNSFFPEVWLLVVGLAILFFLAATA